MKRSILVLLAVVLLSVGMSSTAACADETFIIAPGTTLDIAVYRDSSLSRKYAVDANGAIDMPLVGKVEVAGLSVPKATVKIERALTKYLRKPDVTIFVENYGIISVMGEVVNPGPVPLSGKMYVLDAVGMAGGLKPTASGNRVKVIRKKVNGTSHLIKVKLKDVINKGDVTKDILLKPGDVIIVPERIF